MLKMKNPAAATAELHKDNFVVKPTRNDVAPQSINSQLQQPPARLRLGKKLFSELLLFCRSSNLLSKGRRSKNISELRTRAGPWAWAIGAVTDDELQRIIAASTAGGDVS